MGGLCRDEVEAGAGLVVRAIMANPGFTENLSTKAALEIFTFVVEGIFVERTFLRIAEAVRCGAQADDGTAAVKVIDNGLHLLDGDGLEAREDDQQVSVLQCFGARDVARVA